ncbi:dTDP-4-dehydrorhamnose 3,5-epimerase [Streptomyces sp. NPDC102415]|uniref:dTDP-4-dehydrorhamnose 3,5-epimerase n=1 Tax=Streptomyces sp. NPDC102415 TaxID=3366173 RepID=UPI00380ED1F9
MRQLSIPGAWLHKPIAHTDNRGTFHEAYRAVALARATGRALTLAQANVSVSRRGALRGIHYAEVPPGQAKYVTCLRGAVLDVAVDLRIGSPAYGRWEAVRLDTYNRNSLYLAEGLGHAFLALEDDTTVMYLCSEGYAPQREHAIHPLDPQLAIDWPTDIPLLLSDKDATAPTLDEAAEAGVLPSHSVCLAYTDPRSAEGC